MPALNAEENIRLSLELRRLPKERQRALAALDMVGLAAKAHLRPDQMSHGAAQAQCATHMDRSWCSPTSLRPASGRRKQPQVTQLLADIARDNERIVAS
jgi:hypothetical protein